jgi:hypothetical protein
MNHQQYNIIKHFLIILSLDLSVENVSELNRTHIDAQCVNWSAGIKYPLARVCPLIGSFCLGFTYCEDRERNSDRNIIVHWLLFSGVSYCDNRERVFMFYYDTKEKEHQNTQQSD